MNEMVKYIIIQCTRRKNFIKDGRPKPGFFKVIYVKISTISKS